MQYSDLIKIRLSNQQIANSKFRSAKDAVGFMGAVQAQDYPMSKWAVGVRTTDSKVGDIETAVSTGEIIRTHILRPTWHLVSADDIHWMLDLTAPRIQSTLKLRQENLELPNSLIDKCCKLMHKALTENKFLSRDDLISKLDEFDIKTNRAYHVLLHAELAGLICSGENDGNKQTYTLLEGRISKPKPIDKSEAAVRLAERYFMSHAPATLDDFVWWSGLSVKDARNGLEGIKSKLTSEKVGAKEYWFTETVSDGGQEKKAYLLPAFDEFIISYRHRDAMFSSENHKKAVSSNGIFKPVIVLDGEVAGLWKRTIKKDKIVIETEPFHSFNLLEKQLLEEAAHRYGIFLGLETCVKI